MRPQRHLKFAEPALDLNFFLQHRELAPRELELAFDDADLALAVLARLRAELTENLPDRIAHDAVAILTILFDPRPPGFSRSGFGRGVGRRRRR